MPANVGSSGSGCLGHDKRWICGQKPHVEVSAFRTGVFFGFGLGSDMFCNQLRFYFRGGSKTVR